MRMHTKTGHSLWPPLCGGLSLALVVLLVLVLTHDSDSISAAPAPGTTSATATAVPLSPSAAPPKPGGPVFGDSPTGCLAGTGVDADMVLATQAQAPHTSYGAVEVAASYARWSDRYPWPDTTQIGIVQDSVLSSSNPARLRGLATAYALAESDPQYQKNIPPGPAEFGTHYTMSTRPGRWLIDSTSTTDRVTVHLMLGVVINGTVSDEVYGHGSPVLAWENGAWRVADMVQTSPVIKTEGTPFTGGVLTCLSRAMSPLSAT